MRLVKRRRSPLLSVRRSFTRGALTGIVPAPSVIFRVRPLPFRTTKAGIAFEVVGVEHAAAA
jgi:hypothetical protein